DHRNLHSFPTRRSSDLGSRSKKTVPCEKSPRKKGVSPILSEKIKHTRKIAEGERDGFGRHRGGSRPGRIGGRRRIGRCGEKGAPAGSGTGGVAGRASLVVLRRAVFGGFSRTAAAGDQGFPGVGLAGLDGHRGF